MNNEVLGTTFLDNKKLLFLSYYLEYSIRIGAYASNLFFASIITPYLERIASANQFTEGVFVWGYGIIIYEIIWRIVDKRYKPKFEKKDSFDYEYRVKMEKLIKQLGYYYGFQLAVSLVLLSLGNLNSQLWSNLMWSILGGFSQIFSFFGVALLSTRFSGGVSPKYSLLVSLIGLGFILPLLVYIIYALRIFY